MKDIIYPTIKKKFDELTPTYVSHTDRYHFVDNKGRGQLVYNRKNNMIIVDIPYFMLHYFGIKKGSHNDEVSDIIIKLLEDRLGDEFVSWRIGPDNFIYTTNFN